MATLPIAATSIITPYVLNEDEVADYLQSGNNTNSTVRRGGGRWSLSFAIAPISIITAPADYAELTVFLATNPTFEVPILNIAPITLATTMIVRTAAAVGDTVVDITMGASGQGAPVVGQFIVFSNSSKMYRVASYAIVSGTTGTITLTKPLRKALTTSHTITYTGTDGKSNSIDGVLASFRNPDFGQPLHRIDGGITAQFGPFQLYEAI